MIELFDDGLSDSNDHYSFRELMDLLIEKKEILLTIPKEQEQELRKGLSVRKNKDNAKMKAAGIMPDTNLLSFFSYTHTDENGAPDPDLINIRIKLGPKKSIQVLNIQLLDDSI